MAIEFQSVIVRQPTRLRLRFSNTLASGAFSTSWFTLASLDAAGADPEVSAALVVASAANELELVLTAPLVPGGLYEITVAAGLPAADSSTTAVASQVFRPPTPAAPPSPSVQQSDLMALVYGVDIVHNGQDFVLAPSGDLETVSGPENAKTAVVRRLLSDGLPYNPSYGGRAREFVDAPTPTLPAARGRLEAEARREPRVRSARVELTPNANDGDVTLRVNVELIGAVSASAEETL
jgi:hypothetical protein